MQQSVKEVRKDKMRIFIIEINNQRYFEVTAFMNSFKLASY